MGDSRDAFFRGADQSAALRSQGPSKFHHRRRSAELMPCQGCLLGDLSHFLISRLSRNSHTSTFRPICLQGWLISASFPYRIHIVHQFFNPASLVAIAANMAKIVSSMVGPVSFASFVNCPSAVVLIYGDHSNDAQSEDAVTWGHKLAGGMTMIPD